MNKLLCHLKKIQYSLAVFFILSVFTINAQTTYTDVAPILFEKCATCHRPGGGAPFSVLNYNEIVPRLGSIAHELQERTMPPWQADTSYMHFINERVLTPDEYNSLMDWLNDGGQAGDTTLLPPRPSYSNTLLSGTPDLIVQMPTFQSNANTLDAYNRIVFPTGLTSERYLRAIEIVPANPELTHHIVINADSGGKVPSIITGIEADIAGEVVIGGYQPGANPIIFPNSDELKMGIKMPAGADLVFQIHTPMMTSTGPSFGMDIDLEVRMYFYPENTLNIREVYTMAPLQYWEADFWFLPGEVKSFSTEHNPTSYIPTDISLYSALPHSHLICTEVLNYAYQGTDTIPLLYIDRWDFEHQEYYYYKNLVKVPMNYTYHSTHTYDNSANNHHNPYSPPQIITVGTNTTDEMLFDAFQFIVYQQDDEKINVDSIMKNDPLLAVGINKQDDISYVKSYVAPNPMQNYSSIFFNNYAGNNNIALQVLTLEGKSVNIDYKINGGAIRINRGNMAAGVYIYNIMDRNKTISSGKLVVAPLDNK